MIGSIHLFGIVAALCAIAGQASPIGSTQTLVEKNWPAHDVVERELKVRVESNARRMARGLAPLTPARLYDPERVHTRLSNSPPPSGDSTYGFSFITCYGDHTTGTLESITAASDASAVSQCSAYTSTAGGYEFTLAFTGAGTYACVVSAGGAGASEACTDTNWALYALI